MAAKAVSKTESADGDVGSININIDDITSKHRKERKELQAKIQELKKNAPKSDKKKRKEIIEEISKLEIDLEKRQAQQLNDLNSAKTNEKQSKSSHKNLTRQSDRLADDDEDLEESRNGSSTNNQQRVSKAQKRRNKKAEVARIREAEILASQEESKDAPKTVELQTIENILKDRSLDLHMIPSDGDCLYNAIRHQLQLRNRGMYTVAQLREETAKYIIDNKESLIYYMTNPKTGDVLTDDEFLSYCKNVQNSPAWGGQIELKALSSALKIPIEVLQATGPPTIQGADEFSGPNLTITYHRYMYSLGEHYNSTKPLQSVKNDDQL